MKTNDEALLKIKYNVLRTVSRLAFEGRLEEERDNIPFKLIPGPKAQFRCCVYKEREIIRQRVRLAEGKCPSDKQSNNIIQVISSACEECPITRFVVTDNCQKCMGKACQNACNFGAISIGRDRAHIDPSVCKECGRCAQACPYNAIAELIRPCRRACPVDAITMDPETGICQIVLCFCSIQFQFFTSLHDLEDQFLVFAALLAAEILNMFYTGSLDRGKTKGSVRLSDHIHHIVTDCHFLR